MENVATDVIRQHLIDPEICIRCNTCEETCPIDAITHDSRNYVVRPDVCNGCEACVPPCPTGAIDNWRMMLRERAYPIEDQLEWDELPEDMPLPQNVTELIAGDAEAVVDIQPVVSSSFGAIVPPWSA